MIIGIYGFQDSGKTTLVEDLVKALVRKGYKVASVKHSPHRMSADCEGKDTWRHWQSGSDPVVFSSNTETTMFKHTGTPINKIVRLLETEYAPDVVIVEGSRDGQFPKVSVGNVPPTKGTVLENPSMSELVGYIERGVSVERVLSKLGGVDCKKCGLDCRGLAEKIVDGTRRASDCLDVPKPGVEISIGGKRMLTNKFVSTMVDDTIRGMLSSLKGYSPKQDVEIRLEAKKKPSKRRGSKR